MAYKYDDVRDTIGDCLFHADRRRSHTTFLKNRPTPPNEENSRGLIPVQENVIWRMQFSYFGIGDTYSPYDCKNMEWALLHHPEMPIIVKNANGEVCGKIKMERQQRYSEPVARMYRL